ncbi:ExeM/NucH family extracellular endonuclease [Spirosoma sp. KNUC1025]|uniref:ExeM/NucH family extracellular endonuclease n=1 Tax=Spirosoma sp. KNUC1025 TaxID=2894082 RepID=UPI003863ED9D|nr:ExeM/NucH family extracellular endonuclease [Spirosoma sp. KNUC1025]
MRKIFTVFRLYSNLKKPLPYHVLILMLIGILSNSAYAQLLVKNSFDGTTACPTQGNSFTSASAINATATPLSRQTITCTTAGGVFNSTTLNNTATRSDNSYIEFSITANSGYSLNLTSLSFFRQASNTAPNSLIVSYSTDAANFNMTRVDMTTSTTPTSGTVLTWNFAAPITTVSGGTVTFRFYPFGTVRADGGGAAASATGTFRLDDVSLFGTIVSAADIPPTVASTSPANSAANVAPNTNISVTFSESVTAGASSFSLVGSSSGPHSFTLAGGPTSFTLNPDADFSDGETVTVTALAAQISDQDGTADNMAADYTFSFTVLPPVTLVKIHDIQGNGSTFNTSFSGTQSIEGIVTRKFLGSAKLNGFYVQEEDADADADPLTSEGIFIYDPAGLFTGNESDKVKITGTVAEFTSSASGNNSSLTQLSNLIAVVNLGPGTLPAPAVISLPVANVADLEPYEGMLVTLGAATGNLAVTEYFQLGQYGQIVVSATGPSDVSGTDARLDQYTQYNTPSVAGYATYLAEIAKRKIILDDGSSTSYPDPILFGRGGLPLSASNTLRGGDQIASITTVLDERFEGYRLQLNTGVNFLPTNARPTTPPTVGGSLKVASANVLNYFNGDGTGGGFPTARGANNQNELTRQRTKVLQNLYNSGADVIGLMEVENDGYGSASAIQDLVNGLNTLSGTTSYTFVNPGTSISTDAITVGMIYKLGSVSVAGGPASLSTSAAFTLVGRQPLAQTFKQTTTGAVFTVVVNHFKSKGSSSGGDGDADIADGQGASNGTRTRQAQDLADWLATNPTGTTDPDYLIIGDLNAYAKEDPITTLAAAGFGNLLPLTSYSYVFDGQVGSLDHALATSSLASQVSGAEKWHINADEPTVLDYNTENKTLAQQASLYSPDQFRSSDHDPILIGLNLVAPPTPDLTVVIHAGPSTRYGTSTFSVVGDVVELNSVSSNGTITVRINKDPKISLTFSGTATSVGGRAVQNSAWTFDDTSELDYYVLTTTQVVAAGNVLSFGIDGILTPGATSGTLSVVTQLAAGSGGEVKIINNSDADRIEYFQQ